MKEVRLTQRGWLRMRMIRFQEVDEDKDKAEDEAKDEAEDVTCQVT